MSHGVRKIDELLIGNGRAIILTREFPSNIDEIRWDTVEKGTIFLSPTNGILRYKKTNSLVNEWTKFVPINLFDDKTIITQLLGDKSVTNEKIATDSISNDKLMNDCIDNRNYINNSITQDKLTNNFDGGFFLDNSIDGKKIIDLSLDGKKITKRSVDTDVLFLNSITNLEIGKDCITVENEGLSQNVVLEKNIANNSVSHRNMMASSITINNDALSDFVVTNRKLGNNSISADKFQRRCITANSYALDIESVITENIKEASITDKLMAKAAITLENQALDSKCILGLNIENNTVDLNNIVDRWANVIRNAIFLDSGIATVNGHLFVENNITVGKGNIVAQKNDCTQSITGFKVYNPVFKDFAEAFKSREDLRPGYIVEITENEEVKLATPYSSKVIGVVSDQYALCLGASEDEIKSNEKYAIGLLGRVYVNVIGKADIGDYIISYGNGIGVASKSCQQGCVVGRVLNKKSSSEIDKVLCLISHM